MKQVKKIISLAILIMFLGNYVMAEESPLDLAANWESVILKALEEKYKVTVFINEREEKVLDIERKGSILIFRTDKKEKIAINLPFYTKDKEGNNISLYFKFEQ